MAVIFHVDLDAFYASVEQVDKPEYRGRPVIIGARPGTRGVVAACSYEARTYGVHSAMPISEAYRRCPDGVYLPVRMRRYQEVSRTIMKIFDDYTPRVQQISVDEAFLDMSGTERLFGDPEKTALRLKEQVSSSTGLTLSIGIAPNKYVAKMASEYDKPDGLWRVAPGGEEQFLDSIPLKNLWGVGKKTLDRLYELNITTIPRLREFSKPLLQSMMGEAAGAFLYNAVRGTDPGIFNEEPKSHSISSEVTFEADVKDRDIIKKTLLNISHQVMFRLFEERFKTKTAFLKLRFSDFTTTTVQKTMKHYLHSAEEFYSVLLELLEKRWNGGEPVRLIGAGAASLEPLSIPDQPELFEQKYDKEKKVEEAVLKIRSKISHDSIVKAALLDKEKRKHRPRG